MRRRSTACPLFIQFDAQLMGFGAAGSGPPLARDRNPPSKTHGHPAEWYPRSPSVCWLSALRFAVTARLLVDPSGSRWVRSSSQQNDGEDDMDPRNPRLINFEFERAQNYGRENP